MTTPPDHAPHSPPTAPTFFLDSNFLCLSSSSRCPAIQDCSWTISWNANPSSHVSRNWAPCLTRRTTLSGCGYSNWVWFRSVGTVMLAMLIHSTQAKMSCMACLVLYKNTKDYLINYVYVLLIIIIRGSKGCGLLSGRCHDKVGVANLCVVNLPNLNWFFTLSSLCIFLLLTL